MGNDIEVFNISNSEKNKQNNSYLIFNINCFSEIFKLKIWSSNDNQEYDERNSNSYILSWLWDLDLRDSNYWRKIRLVLSSRKKLYYLCFLHFQLSF
jgi:hypothetical protein